MLVYQRVTLVVWKSPFRMCYPIFFLTGYKCITVAILTSYESWHDSSRIPFVHGFQAPNKYSSNRDMTHDWMFYLTNITSTYHSPKPMDLFTAYDPHLFKMIQQNLSMAHPLTTSTHP